VKRRKLKREEITGENQIVQHRDFGLGVVNSVGTDGFTVRFNNGAFMGFGWAAVEDFFVPGDEEDEDE